MEFKGTKGKWYLQEYSDAYTNIVRCDNGLGLETIYICSTSQSTNKEQRANALLISKAPEMLEMLKELINTNPVHDGWHNKILKANKLIKEATEIYKE